MKKLILLTTCSALSVTALAQWVPGSGIITTTSTEKVGIGTLSPNKQFQVESTDAVQMGAVKKSASSSVLDAPATMEVKLQPTSAAPILAPETKMEVGSVDFAGPNTASGSAGIVYGSVVGAASKTQAGQEEGGVAIKTRTKLDDGSTAMVDKVQIKSAVDVDYEDATEIAVKAAPNQLIAKKGVGVIAFKGGNAVDADAEIPYVKIRVDAEDTDQAAEKGRFSVDTLSEEGLTPKLSIASKTHAATGIKHTHIQLGDMIDTYSDSLAMVSNIQKVRAADATATVSRPVMKIRNVNEVGAAVKIPTSMDIEYDNGDAQVSNQTSGQINFKAKKVGTGDDVLYSTIENKVASATSGSEQGSVIISTVDRNSGNPTGLPKQRLKVGSLNGLASLGLGDIGNANSSLHGTVHVMSTQSSSHFRVERHMIPVTSAAYPVSMDLVRSGIGGLNATNIEVGEINFGAHNRSTANTVIYGKIKGLSPVSNTTSALGAITLEVKGTTTGTLERFRLADTGDLSIGMNNATAAFVAGTSGVLKINGSTICTKTGCTSSSDKKLKKNIVTLKESLEKVLKMRGVSFDYKDKTYSKKKQIGVIAQEVEAIYPEAVHSDNSGIKRVDYGHLVAPLIEAVKEMHAEGVEKDQKIQDLEERLERLERLVQAK